MTAATATTVQTTATTLRRGKLATQQLVAGGFVANWSHVVPTVHSHGAACASGEALDRQSARRWFAAEQARVAAKAPRTLYFCLKCSVEPVSQEAVTLAA
jgi:hypothetical protein